MRALVLSGGGIKGAWQAGAVSYLLGELGHTFDLVAGVSVGALNAAYIAQQPKHFGAEVALGLRELWSGINRRDVYRSWRLGRLGGLFWRSSFYDSSPLRDFVEAHLDTGKVARSGVKLRVSAVSLDTGKLRTWTETDEDELVDGVIASAAFPGMLAPVEFGDERYTDGGVRDLSPVGAAIKAGATEIDVVLPSPQNLALVSGPGRFTAIEVALRAIEILTHEVMIGDLREVAAVNARVGAGRGAPGRRFVELRVLQPDSKLADHALDFRPGIAAELLVRGALDASKFYGA